MDLFKRKRWLPIDLGNHAVFLLQDVGKLGPESVYIEQVSHAYTDACVFVYVRGTDTALGTVDLVGSPCLFLQSIQQKVVGHDDMCSVPYVEIRDIDTVLPSVFHLCDKA